MSSRFETHDSFDDPLTCPGEERLPRADELLERIADGDDAALRVFCALVDSGAIPMPVRAPGSVLPRLLARVLSETQRPDAATPSADGSRRAGNE